MKSSYSDSLSERRNRLAEVAGLFLRLGFTAFGDPAAHIAMMRNEVVQRDVKIAELEVELARYREYFEGLRLQVQQQEHSN